MAWGNETSIPRLVKQGYFRRTVRFNSWREGNFMRKIIYVFAVLLVIAVISFVRYIYVQVTYEGYLGNIGTYSQDESRMRNRFIRILEPIPGEVYFNDKYNVVIKEAWLEYGEQMKNNTFWIKRKPLHNKLVLNIYYLYKNRTTGEVRKKIGSRASVFLSELDHSDTAMEIVHMNLLSKFIHGNANDDFRLEISNGVDRGTIITFK